MNSPFSQERLAAARVLVAGCGALGNEVLKNLVLMGVQQLVVVDFDRIEVGNLSRSVLFGKEDVGQWKVEVAARRLQQMNPAVRVKTICGDIAFDLGLGLVRQMDVVIGCVDNRWARYCINRLCMRAGKPWVDGGIDALEGTVRVFAPGQNCYACNLGPEGLKDMARRQPCSGVIRRNEEAGKAPTTSIIASVIGAVQVQEALKLIQSDVLEDGTMTSLCGKMFYYEGAQLSSRLVDFKAWDPDCPVHDRWEPVRKTAVTAAMPVADALEQLRLELRCDGICIHLTGDCFVDEVLQKDSDVRRKVQLPGRAVAGFVESDPMLSGLPYSSLYQHEYREIDNNFPYPSLTLGQLGIPAQDVLLVTAGPEEYYMEMA